MAFNYGLTYRFNPPQTSAGGKVEIIVTLKNVTEGEVKSVIVSVPMGDIFEKLAPNDDGTYTGSLLVPWMAPAGEYDITLYATSTNREQGPRVYAKYRIV